MLGEVLLGAAGAALFLFLILYGIGPIRRRLGDTNAEALYGSIYLSIIGGAIISLDVLWAVEGGVDELPLGFAISTGIAIFFTFGAVVGLIALGVALILMGPIDFVRERIIWPIEKWMNDRHHERLMDKQIKLRAKEAGRKARYETEEKLREQRRDRGY